MNVLDRDKSRGLLHFSAPFGEAIFFCRCSCSVLLGGQSGKGAKWPNSPGHALMAFLMRAVDVPRCEYSVVVDVDIARYLGSLGYP